MKGRKLSKSVIFAFLLALFALFGGVLFGFWVFRHFDAFILLYGYHAELSAAFHETVVYSMISGILVVLGIGILLLVSLHMFWNTTRIGRASCRERV